MTSLIVDLSSKADTIVCVHHIFSSIRMIGKILGKKIASGLEDKKYLIMGIVLCIGSVGLLL